MTVDIEISTVVFFAYILEIQGYRGLRGCAITTQILFHRRSLSCNI